MIFPTQNWKERDYILAALMGLHGMRADRLVVIKKVEDIKRASGKEIPKKHEDSIQSTFQIHNSESKGFCGDQSLNLFSFSGKKGKGIWSVNREVAEAYLLKLYGTGKSIDDLLEETKK